ncbi:hypothetical protein Ciccas_011842 [Cichlidogyrus casuarinus]|uniref:Uncharacterized protein n=1 Tax=Cichlidogyrus casuarinus TaxID=1844966 RepID=A0ABD2PQZ5_9PLAT
MWRGADARESEKRAILSSPSGLVLVTAVYMLPFIVLDIRARLAGSETRVKNNSANELDNEFKSEEDLLAKFRQIGEPLWYADPRVLRRLQLCRYSFLIVILLAASRNLRTAICYFYKYLFFIAQRSVAEFSGCRIQYDFCAAYFFQTDSDNSKKTPPELAESKRDCCCSNVIFRCFCSTPKRVKDSVHSHDYRTKETPTVKVDAHAFDSEHTLHNLTPSRNNGNIDES